MQSKVYVRVDGSAQIGLGHLVRCIALGQMLKDEFLLHVVSKEVPEKIAGEFVANGFEFTRTEEEESFFAMLSGQEIVVLDNYFFDLNYQKRIKSLGCKLVCIDDLRDKEFSADLIINQVPGTDACDYKAQLYTQFALGPQFALLRKPFLQQARIAREIRPVETVLICFGGADSKNLTCQVLDLVLREGRFKKINVITGAAFHFLDELSTLTGSDSRVSHYHAVGEDQVLQIMTRSGLAIVPASGILLEALSAGCRVISGMYVDNQKLVFEEYKKAQFIESAEDFSGEHLREAIDRIFRYNYNKVQVIDGFSNERVLKCFRQLVAEDQVCIRDAGETDLQKTFEWASDPQIRAFSFNRDKITYEEHSTWFLRKIQDESCCYFIAEIEGEAIGSIRFDIRDNEAVISYLLDTKFHNRGLGIMLLRKGVIYLKEKKGRKFDRVTGFVMPTNIPSVKAFERMGFSKQLVENNFKFTKYLN